MKTYFFGAFLWLCAWSAKAQTTDHCGFRTSYDLLANDSIGVDQLQSITARRLGSEYAFFLERYKTIPPSHYFRRLDFDPEGILLTTGAFKLPGLVVNIGLDGLFLCADTTGNGIRVSKLNAAGDTLWSGVFGLPGYLPQYIADLGAQGLILTAAETDKPNVFFKKGLLLKIDAQQQQEWVTTHDLLALKGYFNRVASCRDGGYFVEGFLYSGYYEWEFIAKFDHKGNYLWDKQLGEAWPSDIIGFCSDASGGLLATVYGLGSHGPSYICEFFHLDAAGNILLHNCLNDYVPDPENTFFIQGECPVVPASNGGYMSGLIRAATAPAKPFILMRLNEDLGLQWTKSLDSTACPLEPLPGGAFLGYSRISYTTIGFMKIGAEGELSPCQALGTTSQGSSGDFNFSIIPNPASEEVTLKIDPVVESIDIQLYNSTGALVLQQREALGDTAGVGFSLAQLPAGVYLWKLFTAQRELLQRVMVVVK